MKYKLKEVCDFYSGTGFPIMYQGEESGQLPFYKVGDIAANVSVGNKYLSFCNNYISYNVANEIKGYIIPKDVIVFAKIGEALKLNRRAITSCDCLIDNNAMGISARRDYLDTRFFYYFMRYLKMENLAESTTVPSVRKSKLENVEINVPSMIEQHKIANSLDTLQSIIIHLQALLTKLDELVKARFVEMFGDPTDSRIERVSLGEYTTNIKYGTSQPPQFDLNGEFKFIRATNIKNGHVIEKDMLHISNEEASRIRKCKLYGGEIIIVRSGVNTGDTCVITDNYKEQYAGYDIIVTLNTDLANPTYINELINIPEYMKNIVKPLTARSAQPHLNTQQVQSLPIIVSPLSLQTQFASFVAQIDKSKFHARLCIDLLQNERMMFCDQF